MLSAIKTSSFVSWQSVWSSVQCSHKLLSYGTCPYHALAHWIQIANPKSGHAPLRSFSGYGCVIALGIGPGGRFQCELTDVLVPH